MREAWVSGTKGRREGFWTYEAKEMKFRGMEKNLL